MFKKKLTNILLLIFCGVCISIKLYIVYFGYVFYHYLVPPGYDVIPHSETIKSLLDKNIWANFVGYPKLFHYIIFYLSQIFHKDSFYILTYWTPVLIIIPSIAMYFLLRQIFNAKTAIITTAFLLFTENYPLYGFVDGNYPNILGYGFFAIFCLAFFIRFIINKKLLDLSFFIIFYALTALTHHLSFAELTSIILFSTISLFIYFLFQKTTINKKLIMRVVFLLIILVLIFLLANRMYGTLFITYTNGLITGDSVIKDTHLSRAVDYFRYPDIVGPIIWYGGLMGLLYLISSFNNSKESKPIKIIIFAWISILFTLSKLPQSGLPERFAREIALPLTVCFAYLINSITHSLERHNNRISSIISYGFVGFVIILNSSLFNPVLLDSLPNSFSNMVWYRQVDQVKTDYIHAHYSKDNPIIINPYANPYMEIKNKGFVKNFVLSNDFSELDKKNKEYNQQHIQEIYRSLIDKEIKININKVFLISPKPSGNTDGIVYPIFGGFEKYYSIMSDITKNQKIIKQFSDGAYVVKIENVEKK